jgi:hypothetical protein
VASASKRPFIRQFLCSRSRLLVTTRRFESGIESVDALKVTFASCVSKLCEEALRQCHLDVLSSISSRSSPTNILSSGDENVCASDNAHLQEHPAPQCEIDAKRNSSVLPDRDAHQLRILDRLHSVQTFSACLYTQALHNTQNFGLQPFQHKRMAPSNAGHVVGWFV